MTVDQLFSYRFDTSAYYALGYPVCALAIWIEYTIAKKRGLKIYSKLDTISNLATLVSSSLVGILLGALTYFAYDWAFKSFSLIHFPEGSIWVWICGALGVDFCYYWFHRMQHQIPALWWIHAIHHQAKELNMSVAMRQPWLSDFIGIGFFWPLAFLGIPTHVFFLCVALLSVYTMFIHTPLVEGRGLWSHFLMTPSHHRVHHSKSRIDSNVNYGIYLTLWDRIFGTYKREESKSYEYGIENYNHLYNPVSAQWIEVQKFFTGRYHTPQSKEKTSKKFDPLQPALFFVITVLILLTQNHFNALLIVGVICAMLIWLFHIGKQWDA